MKMERCLCLFLILFAANAANGDLRISMTRTRTTVASTDLDKKTDADEFALVLGKERFGIERPDYRRTYDFANERIYTLHLDSKTYLDDSLHSDVAYREVEMRSRMGVGPFVKIENLAVPAEMQFELAHLFGMTLDGMNVPDPVEEVRGAVHTFKYNGEAVAEYELDEKPVPDDLRDSFAKFLAYECSIHPFIRRRLCEEGRLFKELRVMSRMGGVVRVTTMTPGEMTPADPPGALVPSDFRFGPEPGDADPVLKIIASVRTATAEPQTETSADLLKKIDSALQEKQFAQAMIYYLQNMLQFGGEDVALLQRISDAAGKDEGFVLIHIGVMRDSRAEAQRAVLALDAIDRSNLKNAYVLDVLKADALSTAGKAGESKWLLIKALHSNPYLAGAYKDLGGILFSEFDMAGAWRCWELCLKLCPGYSLLSKFDSYQEKRRQRHPDFFAARKS